VSRICRGSKQAGETRMLSYSLLGIHDEGEFCLRVYGLRDVTNRRAFEAGAQRFVCARNPTSYARRLGGYAYWPLALLQEGASATRASRNQS